MDAVTAWTVMESCGIRWSWLARTQFDGDGCKWTEKTDLAANGFVWLQKEYHGVPWNVMDCHGAKIKWIGMDCYGVKWTCMEGS